VSNVDDEMKLKLQQQIIFTAFQDFDTFDTDIFKLQTEMKSRWQTLFDPTFWSLGIIPFY